jgi:hypothetical protein
MAGQPIPPSVIAVVGDVLGRCYYSHTRLNNLFMEHGAPGEPPPGNCIAKCVAWLKRANDDPNVNALGVLGGVLLHYMEVVDPEGWDEATKKDKDRILQTLARHGLSYADGGRVMTSGTTAATRTVNDRLRARDLPAVEVEFKRANDSIEADPPAAVTAACAIVEALCKVYLEEEGQPLPSKETIAPLWSAVRSHLGLDPAKIQDQDLQKILSGLISMVDGVGSLRTHAGSAHGHGNKSYRILPRHARLAVNAAHTLVAFVLETWAARVAGRKT